MVLMRPFQCPVRVNQSEDFAAGVAAAVGQRSWALVTSPSWIKAGIDARLADACGRPRAVLFGVKPNPSVSDVIELARNLPDVDVVVALGGGSVLDAAKAVAALNGTGGDDAALMAHLTEGTALPATMTPPAIIAVPTTSGTGSEVTPWGTIWGDDGIKFSINDLKLYPEAAVLDPTLCLTMPRELTLATGLDALSHAMESVWNRRHAPLTDALATQAIAMIRATLETALGDPTDLAARREMQVAAVIAGLAMGTTQTALAHSISYPFTSRFGVPHGLACSFSLAEIARFNGEADLARLQPIAAGLGCAPEAVPDLLEGWLIDLGVPSLLDGYVTVDMVDGLGDGIITRARAANNIRDVDGPMARRLARTSLERLGVAKRRSAAAG